MKPDKHHWIKHNGFVFFIVLLIVSFFTTLSVVEAAVPDRKAPTVPASLRSTAITSSSVTIDWTKSKDNVAVAGYYVYQNNKFIGSTTSNRHTVKNLKANTSYSFVVKAFDKEKNVSASSKAITAKTAKIDLPPKISQFLVTPLASDGKTLGGTVTLSVKASDDKGIKKVEFYSNNGQYLIRTVTSAPFRVNWATNPWVPDGDQVLKVVVYDTANQKTQVSKTVTVKNKITIVQNPYKVIGYYSSWSTYSNFQIANIDVSKLTHLNYAFANISPDGKIALGDSWADVEKPFSGDTSTQPYKGNFYQLTKLKQQYPNLKTLISIGGWTWSERFSDIAFTEESRTIFAQSCLDFIKKYGFDGVDIDWEYPVAGGEADNVNRPEDKQNFTQLIKKIRETFDAQSALDGKKYLVTFAGGAGGSFAAHTELNLLQQYVDYMNLMTYDFHGEWDTLTGMNAPLYRDPDSTFYGEWSVKDAVQTYLNNGVPANKIVMGMPLYGRMFHQASNLNNGLYQPYSGGGKSISYGDLAANYINQNGFIRYWENDSKVPWLFNGSEFISYDDLESIGYKTTYIKSMNLGGAVMWELSQDPNKVLASKIYNDLK